MCPQRSSFLRVMVCLDGMDEGNGGTCFVPGSHLVSDDEAAAMERTTTEPPSSDVEVATCPPGSLVFIHPKVLHGGSRNASDRPRRNLIAQWGPADAPVCLYSEAESLTGLRATRDPSHIRRDLGQRRRDRPDPPLLSPARTT
jgi:phytanoyl-CoA hydroxylase